MAPGRYWDELVEVIALVGVIALLFAARVQHDEGHNGTAMLLRVIAVILLIGVATTCLGK